MICRNGAADGSKPGAAAVALAEGPGCPGVFSSQSYRSIATILDSLDALVYVSDLKTHEILFINAYGRAIWGEAQGKICWQTLQAGQTGPCGFCTNALLLDSRGEPTGVRVWEFQNTVNQRWYQCRDQAIPWVDGRLVRMEIATDITDRMLAEEQLKAAKEQAERLAHTDELTGLNNRRAFMQRGQQLIDQSIRFGHALSVIIFDVDRFKSINDTYGHAAGDTVLQTLAKVFGEHCRVVDNVGRLGGEEFAAVLPETPLESAVALAERLRNRFAFARIVLPGGEISVSASFGVSTYNRETPSLESLLIKADAALYRAKENGRNRIEVAA
jgi:diguanylate cyclase (GGDEF)-like protein